MKSSPSCQALAELVYSIDFFQPQKIGLSVLSQGVGMPLRRLDKTAKPLRNR